MDIPAKSHQISAFHSSRPVVPGCLPWYAMRCIGALGAIRHGLSQHLPGTLVGGLVGPDFRMMWQPGGFRFVIVVARVPSSMDERGIFHESIQRAWATPILGNLHICGAFRSHGATPRISFPFLDGIVHEINHLFLGSPIYANPLVL